MSRPVTRTPRLTALGFGGAEVGNLYHEVEEETASDAIHAAWAGGIRYFDTAPHYGLGLSERRLGTVLAHYPRADYVISTKVGRLLVPNLEPSGSDLASGGFAVDDSLTRRFDFSRSGVLRSLEGSLHRLQTDHVDIVHVHDPDDHLDVAIEETIPALIRLREEGVVRAIGAGMNTVSPLRRLIKEADLDVVMIAGRWTLLDRSAAELLDECADLGTDVVSAAPFNSGLLARSRPSADAYFDYSPPPADVLATAHRLAELCAGHGVALPAAALQFPLRHPAVRSVVAGVGNRTQVEQCLAWMGSTIGEDVWQQLG